VTLGNTWLLRCPLILKGKFLGYAKVCFFDEKISNTQDSLPFYFRAVTNITKLKIQFRQILLNWGDEAISLQSCREGPRKSQNIKPGSWLETARAIHSGYGRHGTLLLVKIYGATLTPFEKVCLKAIRSILGEVKIYFNFK